VGVGEEVGTMTLKSYIVRFPCYVAGTDTRLPDMPGEVYLKAEADAEMAKARELLLAVLRHDVECESEGHPGALTHDLRGNIEEYLGCACGAKLAHLGNCPLHGRGGPLA
jgi:hypothetical protein